MNAEANTPEPPYFAVIFSSNHAGEDRGYAAMADRMVELASSQSGFFGVESARGADGFGITVSYGESEEAIAAWKANAEHRAAQDSGKRIWYSDYKVRVAKVGRDYGSGDLT